MPNAAPTPLDPETVRVALVALDHIPLVWAMLALYVLGISSQLPTAERILRSAQRGDPSYDAETQRAMQRLFSEFRYGRTAGVDKQGDIAEVWRIFVDRDQSLDRPCPTVIEGELLDRLNAFALLMQSI